MKSVLITNNPKAYEAFKGEMEVEFLEGKSYGEVLEAARDAVHRGARLLTHPLVGSLKPNQTPYRSLIIDASLNEKVDWKSLELIENGLASHEKFMRGSKMPKWNEAIRVDFQTVDLSHMVGCVDKCKQSGKRG